MTREILGHPTDKCALLHLSIAYMDAEELRKVKVAFGTHKTKANSSKSYTLYNLRVTRVDGACWSAVVRYSDIYELRRELVEVLPHLKKVYFPPKTYFSFLSCLCRGLNRFDETVIESRKRGMENFLNLALDHMSVIESEQLNSILKLL